MSPKPAISLLNVDEDSQDSINEIQICSISSSGTKTKIHRMECDLNCDLTFEDLRLLIDLFYLPYENGPSAQQIFLDFHWCTTNYSPIENLNQWRCRASTFHNYTKTINRLVQRLITIPNRSLLYDLYGYITDMNSTLSLCSRYLHWMDNDRKQSKIFLSGDIDPGSKRGGLAGDFLNLLPLGDCQSLIKPEFDSQKNIFLIRSMNSNDQSSISNLCTNVCYQEEFDHLFIQYPELIVDRSIGGYWLTLLNNFDLCFSVDNGHDELCAFLLTIIESEKYDKLIQIKWIEQLQQKYSDIDQNFFELIHCPQWIYDQYPVRVQLLVDLTIKSDQIYFIGKKLMKIITDNLLQRGFHGCHAILDEHNPLLHQYYLRLGFVDVPTIDQNDHCILVGKQF